jgi:hypothetical protein
MAPVQIGDLLMRTMIAFRDRTASSIKFYKVNWKNFPEDAMVKIRFDVASVYKRPENPSFAAYSGKGGVTAQVKGASRPDTLTWSVNDMLDELVPSVKSGKGEYLYAGWAITDTAAKYINLADMRKESMDLNGKTETVNITTYKSLGYDDLQCTYERVYAANNKLIGSIESCGAYGKVGYFDYDRMGRMQYRVKYKP